MSVQHLRSPGVLITGAHGFIGRHMAARLGSQGFRVFGLGHGNWPEAERFGVAHWLNGEVVSANLRSLQRANGTPDLVFHFAGGSSVGASLAQPHEDFVRTVGSTAELLEWLRLEAPEARLVAVSSAAVYGGGFPGPIRESEIGTPYSPYGYHKAMMEGLCRSYASSFGLRAVVARLFSVYGPGLRKQLLWDACSRLASGTEVLTLGGTGQELRDWTDVRDVAAALQTVAPCADVNVPVINIGTGISTPVQDIALRLLDCWAHQAGRSVPVAFDGRSRPGDPFSLVAGQGRLAQLGFAFQTDWRSGVADYVRWFRSREGFRT